jgi:hypothetical protein
LTGNIDGAKVDLVESIALAQSLVKLASITWNKGIPKEAFQCFDEAIDHNPNDPDDHRGQGTYMHSHVSFQLLTLNIAPVLFIMNERSSGELHLFDGVERYIYV